MSDHDETDWNFPQPERTWTEKDGYGPQLTWREVRKKRDEYEERHRAARPKKKAKKLE